MAFLPLRITPIFILFCMIGGTFGAEYAPKTGAHDNDPKAVTNSQLILRNFPTRDLSVPLFPKLPSVSVMSFFQFLDILHLYYDTNSSTIRSFSHSNMILIIVNNFYKGHLGDLTPEELQKRRRNGIRYPRYNHRVLTYIQSDERIVKYLGFEGCLQIFTISLSSIKDGLEMYASCPTICSRLENSLGSLQDFLKFFLQRSTFREQSLFTWRNRELAYFKLVMDSIPFKTTFQVGADRVIQIIIDSFRATMNDCNFINFLFCLRQNLDEIEFSSLRRIVTYLIESSSSGSCPFANPESIIKCYSQISPYLFFTIDARNPEGQLKITKTLYINICPVLRALTLHDSLEQVHFYLSVFSNRCTPHLYADLDGPLLRLVDEMMADTKYLLKTRTKKSLGGAVLNLLHVIFQWDRNMVLASAIKRGFCNVVEALFIFAAQVDSAASEGFIHYAMNNIVSTDSVEMLFIVIGYCMLLNVDEMIVIANSIGLSNSNNLNNLNRRLLTKNLLFQAASLLRIFPTISSGIRTVMSRGENERIPLPCPAEIFDSLYPTFYKEKPEEDDYNEYPHYSLINLAQLLLFRLFGIPFTCTRILEDGRDTPEWREVIGYLNFMIEREARLHGITEQIVQFYDPIDSELKEHHLNADEYLLRYREMYFSHFRTAVYTPPSESSQSRQVIENVQQVSEDDGFVLL